MKTILEVTKYVASDGKMFDTREECQMYEDMNNDIFNELKNNVTFINDHRCLITTWKRAVNKDDFTSWFEHAVNECAYVEIKHDLSGAVIDYLDEEIGVIIPLKKGRYRYDFECCDWVSLKHDVEELESHWYMSVAEIAGCIDGA